MTDRRHVAALGRTMLLYIVVVIVLITLAPFRFAVPDDVEVVVRGNGFDLITNTVLFAVPGFLFRMWTGPGRDRFCVIPLLLGLLLSTNVEVAQMFLPGRYSTLTDLVTNAGGAWFGALFHDFVVDTVRGRLRGALFLELPLMGVVYLLTVLLWLHGYASADSGSRTIVGVFLGFTGSTLISAVWFHRLRPAGVLGPWRVALLIGVWFLISSVTSLAAHPQYVLVTAVLLVVDARVFMAHAGVHGTRTRRFETPTLRRAAPWFVAYLVATTIWPWEPADGVTFSVGVWISGLADTPALGSMLHEIEYLAGATLGGYVLAESFGRRERARALAIVVVGSFNGAFVIEVLRTVHPAYHGSIVRGAFAFGAALLGAVIYRQQLAAVRSLLRRPAR